MGGITLVVAGVAGRQGAAGRIGSTWCRRKQGGGRRDAILPGSGGAVAFGAVTAGAFRYGHIVDLAFLLASITAIRIAMGRVVGRAVGIGSACLFRGHGN